MVLPTGEDNACCVQHHAAIGDRAWAVTFAGAPKARRAWGCVGSAHQLWILGIALCISSEVVGKKLLAKVSQHSCPAA